MKKTIAMVRSIITLFIFLCLSQITLAAPADPTPRKYKQPDGSTITIVLKGDEKVSWAETSDGFTILSNGKNGWEYAVKDNLGNLNASGILAHEVGKRAPVELNLIKNLEQKARFSSEQVNLLKQIWEAKHNSEKLINTGSFFKPNLPGTSNNNGLKSTEAFSPQGVKKLLLILIQYPNLSFTFSKADFQGLMNTQNYNLNGADGSVRDFFLEQSYNKFDVQTDVAGIYTAQNNLEYYGTDSEGGAHDPNAHFLMEEAVTYADADVDFTQYDNDSDGSVDGVYIIYAGKGQASSGIANTIWPHAGGIAGQTFDGKTVSKYSCSNELNADNSLSGIGVICHEFGHVCGAPDYYDTDYLTGGHFPGTGNWDIMCGGCYNGYPYNSGNVPSHFNPMEKIKAGWVTPIILSGSTSLTIPDYTSNPAVYIINTQTPNEYYLLENRQQTGFNRYVNGHGLLIYRFNSSYWNNHANKTYPEGFFLVSANITTNPTASTSDPNVYGTINSGSCPFPGTGNKTSFTDATTPSMQSWAGENTGYPITNIAENSGIITLCFNGCPSVNSVQNFQALAAGATQINLSWLNNANVIIARNSVNNFGNLETGTSYSVGNSLTGGGEIVFTGTASSFNDNTGLSASTIYYYQIWSTDGSANYSSPNSAFASTTCNSNSQALFIEGFEGGAIPSCWTQEFVSNTYNWTITTKSGYASTPASAHSGSKLALFYDGAWKSPVSKLITPPLDLSDAAKPTLKFWYTQAKSGANQDKLYIYYRTSATSEWKLLNKYLGDTPAWTLESIDLPEASSTYYIAFEGYASNGCGICLDDVEVWKDGNATTNNWLGATSNDWFTASNWSLGIVPTATIDIEIPSGTTYSPSIEATGAVCKNITIDAGATLSMSGTTAYTLSVNGNWTNNGIFTYGLGVVSFDNQTIDQTIGGSSTTNFYMVKVNKGSQAKVLEATSLITLNAPRQNWNSPMEIIAGTFKLSSASTIIPFQSGTTIHADEGIWNNGGTLNFAGYTFYNQGLFRNSLGISTFSFLISYSNTCQFVVDGGTVNITGYFGPYNGNSYSTTYTQSGGNFIVNSTSSTIPFNINATSATFNMSGGNIIFQKASSASLDYQNLASNFNVTGGTLQIGNASTTSNQTIRINSTAPIQNLLINPNNSPTAQLVSNGLTVKNQVTIGSNAKIDLNSLNIAVAGNWTNNGGTLTATPSGTVILNGSSEQSIAGTSGSTFNNLTIDNPSGVTTPNGLLTTVNGTLLINSGKKLTIASGSKVTAGSLTNNADATGLVIKSNATGTGSLIASNVSGSATAESYITGGKWHNVSPIASGANISSFIQNSANGIPSKEVNETTYYGMMEYNTASNIWNSYYTSSTSETMAMGKGYSLRRITDGIITYTGNIASGNQSVGISGTGEGWNCVGNPYPSAIAINNSANPAGNFLKSNAIDASNLDPSYSCIYVWDNDAAAYKIIGNSSYGLRDLGQNIFQSGQGFFIKANSGASTIQFSSPMQQHQNETILKSGTTNWPGIELSVTDGKKTASTIITFNEQMTLGLDPTYDAGLLKSGSGLEVYSRLINDNGINFAIQCLPEKYDSLIIPIGIDYLLFDTLTVKIQITDIPEDCIITFEDRAKADSLMVIDNSSFTLSIDSASQGIGRFFLHLGTPGTKEETVSSTVDNLSNLHAYYSAGQLVIEGSNDKDLAMFLSDLNGRVIKRFKPNNSAKNYITVPEIPKGVYLLSVFGKNQKTTKKIVVR